MHSGDFRVQTTANTALGIKGSKMQLQLVFDAAQNNRSCTQSNQVAHFILGTSWRTITAQFGPFALNQHFVRQLQKTQPQRVVIEELNGATADLARIALAMGIPTSIESEHAAAPEANAQRWTAALRRCIAQQTPKEANGPAHFGYEMYALGMRNHDLLAQMQAPHVEHFLHSQCVLDVGCGTGVFLDLLRRQGVQAEGVERNISSARFAASLGLNIHTEDALDFLARHPQQFDGLYCSHFVEHLPIDAVERLIALCAQALQPGGVAVFTFPDPESIRSQLLGFWRDPEHVRFYHPELIETLAEVHGLQPEFNSQHIAGRTVGPFSMQPPPASPTPAMPLTVWQRLFKTLGLSTTADMAVLQAQNRHQQQLIDQLWQVNQTWAWEDNVVLRLRKPLS